MSAVRCPRRFCGAPLSIDSDGRGAVVATCPPCARNKQGLCRDCPRSLAKANALRCPTCAAARAHQRTLENSARYYAENRDRVLARQRKYLDRPDRKARAAERGRAWYLANKDEAQRAYMREYNRRWRQQPKAKASERKTKRRYYQANREAVLARHREWYAKNRDRELAKQRERNTRAAARRAQERAA